MQHIEKLGTGPGNEATTYILAYILLGAAKYHTEVGRPITMVTGCLYVVLELSGLSSCLLGSCLV